MIAGFALGGISVAHARPRGEESFVPTHNPGTPLLAVVGLKEQRVSIYDAKGKIMESPVSSGQTGYETPAGIYSIVQKEEEHFSNLYDDASMPFMERITWSGMALHAGVLPGYPASHGCVRLPSSFAERLYEVTKLGMRVLVLREDIAPAEVPQPFMFGSNEPKATRTARAQTGGVTPSRYSYDRYGDDVPDELRLAFATKSAAAQNAAMRVRDARLAAAKKAAESTSAAQALKSAENAFNRVEIELKAAGHAVETASPDRVAEAEADKAQALARLQTAQTQLDAARHEAQFKADASTQAQNEIKAADIALAAALEASEEARQNLLPVSVLISRKTQRLYIRRANMPVFEAPVIIRDAGKPIGTFVYTALERDGTSGIMRWNVVSMYKDATKIEPFERVRQERGRHAEAAPADVGSAQAALERLTLTPESIERMSQVVLPGSSLIVSDEGPSIETGKDTDFVIFMSGEPQGGIAIRSHPSARRDDYDDDFPWRSHGGRSRSSGSGWGFPW
jgi:hypothetical protein